MYGYGMRESRRGMALVQECECGCGRGTKPAEMLCDVIGGVDLRLTGWKRAHSLLAALPCMNTAATQLSRDTPGKR